MQIRLLKSFKFIANIALAQGAQVKDGQLERTRLHGLLSDPNNPIQRELRSSLWVTWIKQSLCLHMSLIDSASEVEEVALVIEKLWRSPHLRFYSPCTVRVEKSRSENGRGGLSERAQKKLVLKNHSSWRHRSASFQRCCERGNSFINLDLNIVGLNDELVLDLNL